MEDGKVPQGTYTLVWDEVSGYQKPESVTITIGYFASSRDEFSNMKIHGISGYFEKKLQTAPVLFSPPLQNPTQVPSQDQTMTPEKEITPVPREPSKKIVPSPAAGSEQKSIKAVPAQLPPSKPQRGFFSRFWESVSSFFRRLF
jgi:hypothetical protein